MINPISFKGTFCIQTPEFDLKSREKVLKKQQKLEMKLEKVYFRNDINETYITVPDYNDEKTAKLLKKYDVPYYYFNVASGVDKAQIPSRIKIDKSDEDMGYKLVNVDVEKLDKLLETQSEYYVGYKAEGGNPEKYEAFRKFLHTKHDIQAPKVSIIKNFNGNFMPTINDGRHRFAVLRDMGLKTLPVAMTEQSEKFAQEAGIIV